MCGVSGFVSEHNKSNEMCRSLLAIRHRGPDSSGTLVWGEAERFFGIGHVRLSVIDLSSSGNQPMLSRDKRVAMVFNGEIYNHTELKVQLDGHEFVGHSDSEVLLEYFCRYGVEGFSKLRGMFAAVFYELDSKRMVLLRDQIGIKPLYYKNAGRNFYFSSEIRGLLPFLTTSPSVSREDLFEFLSSGFVYEPNTGFEGIHKLPAGHYAIIENDGFTMQRYFSLEEESKKGEYSADLITRSIEQQLEADAKLGVFYSGGIDSSVIAAFAKRPCLFAQYSENEVSSLGRENDEPYADEIAKRLNINFEKISVEEGCSDADSIIASMRQVARGTEELISDYTYFASAKLSEAARERGFKVMLSGLGGDEVFVGYPRYRLLIHEKFFCTLGVVAQIGLVRNLLRHIPSVSKKIDRFASFYKEGAFSLRYTRLQGYFQQRELEEMLGKDEYESCANRFVDRCNIFLKGFESDSPLIRALILDYHGFLSHNLTVSDKSSMSVGLELRVPLLAQDLYCSYLGALRSGKEPITFGKSELKKLLLLRLPRLLIERKKTGFNPPLDGKISSIGELRILEILNSGMLNSLLNGAVAEMIVRRHFAKQENNSFKIWQLLYLSFWLDEHIKA
jgi:asparagine synthase (glutamine-hydrolysing)